MLLAVRGSPRPASELTEMGTSAVILSEAKNLSCIDAKNRGILRFAQNDKRRREDATEVMAWQLGPPSQKSSG
jgi:hypothetical protein